jgi:hypothetical protein
VELVREGYSGFGPEGCVLLHLINKFFENKFYGVLYWISDSSLPIDSDVNVDIVLLEGPLM